VYRVPKRRAKAQPHVQHVRATIKGLVTSPRRSLTVMLSSFATGLYFAMCLGRRLLERASSPASRPPACPPTKPSPRLSRTGS
jgi:hypothetical protein